MAGRGALLDLRLPQLLLRPIPFCKGGRSMTIALKKTGDLRRKSARKEAATAYLFLAPSLFAFLVFILVPLIIVVYISFTKYNVIQAPVFNDYKNWIKFTLDKKAWISLKNSFKFLIILVPMHVFFSMLLALGVNAIRSKIFAYAFRTVFYFPTLLAASSVAIAWKFILSTDFGILNYYLGLIGIAQIPWLNSSFWVYPAVMIFSLWKFVGSYFLYLYIGLRGIDRTYMEAAEIDGASRFVKFRHITLPLMSPTLFFVFITSMISTVQIFTEPYMLTSGGPGNASRTLSLYIYETAYGSQNYGYASALALCFLTIVLIMTLLQFRNSSWVNYDR